MGAADRLAGENYMGDDGDAFHLSLDCREATLRRGELSGELGFDI